MPQFTVTLDKSSGKPLGFMIDKNDPANLRINSFHIPFEQKPLKALQK